MIKIENLSYSYPQKELYDNISFTIEEGNHCAFLGSSGSGKSTLVDMIMNPDNYLYDGKIEIEPTCRIGYVSQFSNLSNESDFTVFQYIGEQFIKYQKEIEAICSKMETATELETLLEQFQDTMDAYNAIGGDAYESNIKKKLKLANLDKLEEQLVSKLSGGEFKLIQVIKEMLTEPDLIIMDEPDVFLDFENLNALKDLINSHKGAIIIITHNRYLLNHCFNKILHLENKELQEFEGRYIDYNFKLLQTKVELQELYVADSEEIARNEQIIERLRKIASNDAEAARGKSLYARIKIQERLEARRIKAPFVDIKIPEIHFNNDTVLEESIALKVEDYGVSFDELLLEHVNFEVISNEKVAIIGPNGTGKTTLLRDIYKNNNLAISIQEDINVAFLSQNISEVLDESVTIMDYFLDMGFKTYTEVINYLEPYGFTEEVLNQKIGDLSGGEKNILQLAKISASNVNFLLLDEPTSHLDTYAQVALENAIKEYKGGVLMVSHDFYTIANCVDYVLLIEDKSIRKLSIRKFRKMIYEKHFNKEYLEIEQKKKAVEEQIELALKETNFEKAKVLVEELENYINLL